MIDTKDKILDAAEQLFGDTGYAATSMRHIIATAGVNLAAIHYHFGSKEGLLDQLISRRADPVNRARIAMLERAEAEAGGSPVPLEKILEAFLAPAAEMAAQHPGMPKVMGRLYAEGTLPAVVRRHFEPTAMRFVEALRRTLPELPERDFTWRMHFMIGAMAHMLGSPPFFMAARSDSWEVRIAQLVAFLAGGFHAPAATAVAGEVEIAR